ncbi:unnamed protein product [Heligmosomoides polygyrus]|uniref:Glycine-rich cell wall structural protein 1 n=1 Tax=Heligmosomoides polygyrus TaxID=6339 RepID=A0A183F1Z3_HELPZ|nr:unnamed protein product [Heligmosomoides polygyrus]
MTLGVVSLLVLQLAAVAAQFYGSLGGYACAQPVLYYQCQCPTFCSGYGNGYGNGNGNSYGNGASDYYSTRRRIHPKRRHHKKKKFRFETLEEIDSNEFPEPPSTTSRPRSSTHTWEDEDLWEKKFVNPKTKETEASEEFPEISSAEIAAAKARLKGRVDESELTSVPTRGSSSPGSGSGLGNGGGGGGGGIGIGSGIGVGGIGVSSGLGIGAPGIGGLGGGGGIFGISSGIGVGVPGVGPIGVSSGLGIGR